MKQLLKICSVLITIVLFQACGSDNKATVSKPQPVNTPSAAPVKIPAFIADSSYVFIEKQLNFGTRVPGTETHKACKEWLVKKFKGYGADVIEQDFTADFPNGESAASTNIIAQFNPKMNKRVILAAHWDTRMFGDQDEDPKMRNKPIPGADDGGSGVGVLLEIARLIKDNPIDMGIDIILFDAEDQGASGTNDYWCLGSKFWSRNKHINNYSAQYGILLDMVGAKNPTFGKDDVSRQFAGAQVEKLWTLAARMGYSDMFVNKNTGQIIDDHVYVNTIANIPMLDIINRSPNTGSSFQKCWHTHCDDLSVINKRSLKVVGQVVTAAIYKESTGNF